MTLLALVVAACALLAACSISPQPVPPPEPNALGVDSALVTLEADGPEGVTVVGAPGAVTPGAETLRALNLGTLDPAAEVPVAEDGSFSVVVSGTFTDAYRLRARAGQLFSDAVDILGAGATGSVGPVPPPYEGCLRIAPERELLFEPTPLNQVAAAALTVTNECSYDIMIAGVSLRAGDASFEPLFTMTPEPITLGTRRIFAIAFVPTEPGLHEDELVIILNALQDPPAPIPLDATVVLTLRGEAFAE